MKTQFSKYAKLLFAIVSISFLSGCVTNAVTGEKQLSLVGEAWEYKVGKQAYAPSIQSQGGEYLADPKVQEYVQEVTSRLAAVSDRELPYEIVVLNNSVPNAWALPSGKMAINRGLLVELNNEAELAAVIGHEIIHAAASHGAAGQTRGTLLQGALLAGAIATEGDRLLMTGANIGAQLINQRYSREAELESDEYGMLYMSRAGYDPSAAIGLQETFVRLSEGRKTNWLNGLFSSHPPSKERVAANKEHAKRLPAGGELGKERYQEVMRHLKEKKPAYDAYDEAKVAVKKGDYAKAKSLLAKAKSMEDNEALFDILEGDIEYRNKNYQSAIRKYNQAIDKNPKYFEGNFSRGLAYYQLENFDKSYPDLKKTAEMFPGFPLNYFYLGLLEERRGDVKSAVSYLSRVANPNTELGKRSHKELQRLSKKHPQYFNRP